MKTGMFYSIFSNDEIGNSISYVCKLCSNIKQYNSSSLGDISIVVNTDEFTYKIIKDICRQEEIDLSNIVFHKHRRNMGLRGMFWRFESFYADEYDITVNAEGDYDISKYLKELEFFENSDYTSMLHSVRKISVSRNAFAGGKIYIKPKSLDSDVKEYVKRNLELFDHIDDVDYGVDEYFLIGLLEKYFRDKHNIIVVNDRARIKDGITDFGEEKANLEKIFTESSIVSISDFDKAICGNGKYKIDGCEPLSYYMKTEGGKVCYCLYDKCLKIKKPFRVNKSDFCQERLMDFIK